MEDPTKTNDLEVFPWIGHLQIGPDLWQLPDEQWPQNPAASFHYTGWFRPRDSPIGLL